MTEEKKPSLISAAMFYGLIGATGALLGAVAATVFILGKVVCQ